MCIRDRFQLLRYFGSQDDFTQQLSLMSAELGEALSPAQMQSIMNRYLTALNIQHAQLISVSYTHLTLPTSDLV